MLLSVSELAERAKISADAVRYYGRLGLLPETGRNDSGYRYYDEVALERLRFIKGAQWLQLRLEEIAELLECSDNGRCPCAQAEAMLHQRIRAIDEQTVHLAEIRAGLCRLLGFPDASSVQGNGRPRPANLEPAATEGQPALEPHRAHAGCECCGALGPPSTEEEHQELQARLKAVETRLRWLQAGEVGQRSRAVPPVQSKGVLP